jgi:hypothetical protein
MFKKLALATLVLCGLSAATVAVHRAEAGNDDTAAILLSSSFPGVGEWYRAGFSGGFPLVECILGEICPCVRIASMIDAAAGKTDDSVRFDFWSSPA